MLSRPAHLVVCSSNQLEQRSAEFADVTNRRQLDSMHFNQYTHTEILADSQKHPIYTFEERKKQKQSEISNYFKRDASVGLMFSLQLTSYILLIYIFICRCQTHKKKLQFCVHDMAIFVLL